MKDKYALMTDLSFSLGSHLYSTTVYSLYVLMMVIIISSWQVLGIQIFHFYRSSTFPLSVLPSKATFNNPHLSQHNSLVFCFHYTSDSHFFSPNRVEHFFIERSTIGAIPSARILNCPRAGCIGLYAAIADLRGSRSPLR